MPENYSMSRRRFAQLLGHQLLFGELLAHSCRVGVLAVDLRDRDDDRNLGRARVADRLEGLRHHAVVGRDAHQEKVNTRRTGHHRALELERKSLRPLADGDESDD